MGHKDSRGKGGPLRRVLSKSTCAVKSAGRALSAMKEPDWSLQATRESAPTAPASVIKPKPTKFVNDQVQSDLAPKQTALLDGASTLSLDSSVEASTAAASDQRDSEGALTEDREGAGPCLTASLLPVAATEQGSPVGAIVHIPSGAHFKADAGSAQFPRVQQSLLEVRRRRGILAAMQQQLADTQSQLAVSKAKSDRNLRRLRARVDKAKSMSANEAQLRGGEKLYSHAEQVTALWLGALHQEISFLEDSVERLQPLLFKMQPGDKALWEEFNPAEARADAHARFNAYLRDHIAPLAAQQQQQAAPSRGSARPGASVPLSVASAPEQQPSMACSPAKAEPLPTFHQQTHGEAPGHNQAWRIQAVAACPRQMSPQWSLSDGRARVQISHPRSIVHKVQEGFKPEGSPAGKGHNEGVNLGPSANEGSANVPAAREAQFISIGGDMDVPAAQLGHVSHGTPFTGLDNPAPPPSAPCEGSFSSVKLFKGCIVAGSERLMTPTVPCTSGSTEPGYQVVQPPHSPPGRHPSPARAPPTLTMPPQNATAPESYSHGTSIPRTARQASADARLGIRMGGLGSQLSHGRGSGAALASKDPAVGQHDGVRVSLAGALAVSHRPVDQPAVHPRIWTPSDTLDQSSRRAFAEAAEQALRFNSAANTLDPPSLAETLPPDPLESSDGQTAVPGAAAALAGHGRPIETNKWVQSRILTLAEAPQLDLRTRRACAEAAVEADPFSPLAAEPENDRIFSANLSVAPPHSFQAAQQPESDSSMTALEMGGQARSVSTAQERGTTEAPHHATIDSHLTSRAAVLKHSQSLEQYQTPAPYRGAAPLGHILADVTDELQAESEARDANAWLHDSLFGTQAFGTAAGGDVMTTGHGSALSNDAGRGSARRGGRVSRAVPDATHQDSHMTSARSVAAATADPSQSGGASGIAAGLSFTLRIKRKLLVARSLQSRQKLPGIPEDSVTPPQPSRR
ncbi:hypothetical protein WJX73_007476 [Symbiochloris irregularis]|uniref:Uncharacterized protein n=1 Tax=Symbiochloris irregularis TaxID=706552 RepID=A0AAW1P2S4_9CHLO